MKFAAFIMTFERPHIIESTINKLLEQSLPPQEILIVDNSISYQTEEIIKKAANPKVSYHRVGYNSGPAGASAIGLQMLADKGYDWIYWGDDDDPPADNSIFEKILNMPESLPNAKIGILGSRGCNFDRKKGVMEKILNKDLKTITQVDCIPGGGNIIVNSQVVKDGILPDEGLFFSFEDLDFALSMTNKGYQHFITGDDALKIRIRKKRGYAPNSFFKSKPHSSIDTLWRDYYSYRNLLKIYLYKNKLFTATLLLLLRGITRSVLGFSNGYHYGIKNFKYVMIGILHGFFNKKGLIITPIKKHN